MGGRAQPGGGTSVKVVVVGGGLAGLAAGIAAADAGADVLVLERRPRLGGATWSFERNGRWFDNGQHVFLRCCTAYRSFLDRIGASDSVHMQDRLEVPVVAPGGRTEWIRRSAAPAPLHLGSLLAYGHLPVAERLHAGRVAIALRLLDMDDPALDQRSFGSWLREQGASERSIEALWNLICLPTINLPADRASLALATKVFRTGLLERADAADIGWTRVPLSVLHGEMAARALAGEIRTRAGVDEILPGPAVVVDGERIDADAVVVAVPHDAVASLLPEHAGVTAIGSSPIVNVHVVYDRPVMDLPFVAGIDTPAQWVFDRTEPSGRAGTGEQIVAVSLSGAEDIIGTPSRQLVDEQVAALAELFPAAAKATVLDTVVTREHTATFRGTPGTAQLRPGPLTSIAGVFVAGSWTDTGWPATMESAVRSGNVAVAAATATAMPVEVAA